MIIKITEEEHNHT